MSDRVLFPLLGFAALAMIGIALVWPQGLGARSPGPLGHEPVQQVAARQARSAAPAAPAILGMAPVAPAAPPAKPGTAP